MRKSLMNKVWRHLTCPSLLTLAVAVAVAAPAIAGSQTVDGADKTGFSQAEMLAFHEQVTKNWNIPADLPHADKVRVAVHMKLDRSGQIIGSPEVTATGGPEQTRNAVAKSASRAVLRSAPFKNLPLDKYDAWKEVIINFDTSNLAH
ncbi:TonB C-terminal domain-containing protein [Agrobacterium rhizogenes]|nr:TonB C-terminal domain-containing protein [Rhizobium rhizogenes]